jgi:pilus assembly protein CpaB
LSLIIAGIAVMMVLAYIDGREAEFKAKYGDLVQVVVAKEDIQAMETIDDRKLLIITVPGSYKMPGAFNQIESLYNSIAATSIKKGEQITAPRIIYPGEETGLSRQISEGKRAVSIQINADAAVGQLVKPGDRVDVLSIIDYGSGRIELMKAKTVLQDVYVLATGKRVTKEIPLIGLKVDKEIKKLNLNTYNNFNTITLELSPNEVQKLLFLVKVGKGVYLSLRNNTDKTIERIGGTRLFDVLGEDAAEAKSFFAEKKAQLERRR